MGIKQANARQKPVPDRSSDLVVSAFSLHRWDDPIPVLNEVACTLRPCGSFLIRDLRRDLDALSWLSLWFARRSLVRAGLRRTNEPLSSRGASYTPREAAQVAD